jgi:hypothetical protein
MDLWWVVMELGDVKHQGASVVVAYEMVQCEGIRCLCGQRCVVEFVLGSFGKIPLQEMAGVGVQGEEEVM